MTTHTERLQAALAGEILDRPPVALWRHFPVDDQNPELLARSTLQFQSDYEFDLVKVTPASSFCLKDWGVTDEWRGNPEGTRDYTKRVIDEPNDWESLPLLDVKAPHLAAQLECLRLIRAKLGNTTPILQTIFSPLAQAKNLAGAERLLAHIRLYPEAVQNGLLTISQTTQFFVEACMETGIDGVFYAVQHAQAGLLSLSEYHSFGVVFDRQVLQSAEGAWCNMLHLHGRNVYFDTASQLPVQIVNWHDRETPPSLDRAASQFHGVLCGGLRQDTLVFASQAEVQAEAAEAIQETHGRKFLLSTGCVVPIIAPLGNLHAARLSVESVQSAGSQMDNSQ